MKIAFLGLGVMGFPMAGHLSQQGYDVTVFNRTVAKAEKWIKTFSGEMKTTPFEAVEDADVVFSCLGGDVDLEEVLIYQKTIHNMKPGHLLVDHTTASAEIARKLQEICEQHQVRFIDAPISGGQVGAEKGILSIMIGASESDYNAALPIMQSYGKNIALIGPVGAGQTAKMMNQICIASLLQGLSEAIAFGKKSGIDLDKVFSVISKGAAQSWQMENRAKTMIAGEYDFGFAVKWMIKDLKIALDEASKLNAPLEETERILKKYEKIAENGGENLDTSSLLSLLES